MKSYFLLIAFFWGTVSFASTPTFDNISDDDFKTITKEFSAMFIHTSATPPTSLGKVFGIEAAVIAGVAEVPGIEEISKRVDPSTDLPYAPFATLFGAISIPYGVTVETNLLPSMDVSGLKLSHYGAGVKWSVSDVFFSSMPFDLAIKTYFSKSELGFSQTLTSPPASVAVDFENNMFGAEALFGVDVIVAQPYVGFGYVRSSSELTGVAAGDPSFSLFADNISQSKKNDVKSSRLILGCQFNLTLLKLSLEYNRVFDTNRLAAKLGFAF